MNCTFIVIFLLLVLNSTGCGRASNEIDYQGEKIKLSRSYSDYDDYKNDPNNIDPSETARVQRLVMNAPIPRTFKSRLEASKAIGKVAFPGYGSGGFNEQTQADGSVLMGFFVEIPRADKERYFIFHGREGIYKLIDDFVYPDAPGLIHSVVRRGDDLVFSSIEGKEVLVRPYPRSE
jgi:hypothetical protein